MNRARGWMTRLINVFRERHIERELDAVGQSVGRRIDRVDP